jgi:hypothetical protein
MDRGESVRDSRVWGEIFWSTNVEYSTRGGRVVIGILIVFPVMEHENYQEH